MEAEGLPAGALSLEGEPALVGAITERPDPPAAEPVSDDETVPDGTIEGTGGVQFAPVRAVIAERTQRKEAQKEAAALKTQLTEAQAKAQKYDELAGYVDQARPIIEAVRNRPDLVEQARRPAPAPETPKALSDAEAVEYAKDLDLYKPDGTPDVDRAQRLAGRQAELASRSAQAAIAPFQANDAQRASTAMLNQLATFKDANGHTVDTNILKEVWAGVPAELSQKPEVAGVLYQIALAQSIMQGKYKGTQPPGAPPVVVTESLGSTRQGPKEIDAFGAKFARAADIKPAEFVKQSERFKPGQTNSLE